MDTLLSRSSIREENSVALRGGRDSDFSSSSRCGNRLFVLFINKFINDQMTLKAVIDPNNINHPFPHQVKPSSIKIGRGMQIVLNIN
jgi:hypothetical protein